ncbi:MAG: sodium:solute symporter family protein [Candidatus Woesearchaeota archaeon]|nr:sodium:solute symporter family protein [Candidatus Woesearchaeota archaeon]
MAITLNPIDYSLIVIYILVVLYLGWRAGRKETREGYLLADRNLNAMQSTATICSSKIGAGLLLSYFGLVYVYGVAAWWLFVGFVIGYTLFYFFAKRLKRLADEKRYYTLSDYFFDQYGQLAGYTTAVVVLLAYLLNFTIQLIGGAKVIATLTGMTYGLSLLIMSTVIITYIMIGGFKAVVKTDIMQYIAIIALTGILALFLFDNFTYIAADWNPFGAPVGLLIVFLFSGIMAPFASAELWQRVYATKTARQAKRSLIAAMSMYILYGILLAFVGMIIKTTVLTTDPDIVLVLGFQELLPPGVLGLGIIVLYAAVMSSADTLLFTSASITIQDIVGRFRRNRNVVFDLRIASFTIGILGLLVAWALPHLLDVTYIYAAIYFALSLVIMLSWFRRMKEIVFVGSICTGLLVVLIALPFVHNHSIILISWAGSLFGVVFFVIIARIFPQLRQMM